MHGERRCGVQKATTTQASGHGSKRKTHQNTSSNDSLQELNILVYKTDSIQVNESTHAIRTPNRTVPASNGAFFVLVNQPVRFTKAAEATEQLGFHRKPRFIS